MNQLMIDFLKRAFPRIEGGDGQCFTESAFKVDAQICHQQRVVVDDKKSVVLCVHDCAY